MRLPDLIAAELKRAANNARTLYRLEASLEEVGDDELDREQVLHVRTELIRVWISEMTWRELADTRFIVEEECEERPEYEETRYRRRRRWACRNPPPSSEPIGPTLMDPGSGRDLGEVAEREERRKTAEEMLYKLTGVCTPVVFPDEIGQGAVPNPFGGGRAASVEVASDPETPPEGEGL